MKNKNFRLFVAALLFGIDFWSLPAWAQITISTNTTISATNVSFESQDIIVTNCAVLVNGPHNFSSLWVQSNGVVSCTVGQSNLNLTVTGNLTVDLGGSVLVDGLGYQGPGSGNGNGPGGGGGAVSGDYATGGGGGYGGLGGQANSGKLGGISYGSLTAPTNWGSSGGTGHDSYSGYYYAGGNGGGAMQLVVGGQLQVNGQITANGNNAAGVGSGYYYYPGGGGAGGSLWITASNLTGTGSIAANGGRSWNGNYGTGGGGGGGRIALYYTNSSFAGTFSAVGGYGNQYGGAGTVYTKSASQTWGQLTLNNGGNAGAVTVLPGNAQEFDNVIIGGQAQAQVPANAVVTLVPTVLALGSNFNLTINGQLLCAGQAGGQFTQVRVANGGTMTLGAGSQLACADLQVFSGGTFVLNATNALTAGQVEVETNGTMLLNVPVSFPTLHVTTNGVVSCTVGQSNLNLTVTGNLTVDLGGSVLVDGLGYQGPGSGNGNGPGGGGGAVSGDYATGGGGGYGGLGGQANSGKLGGISYGSLTAPTNWGSSGGTGHDSYSGYYYAGGNGGGAMQLVVGGQLQVNGQITANGNNAAGVGSGYYYYPGGGGAGGSLWITASNLTGTGSIAANGGRSWNGNYGTGGGGGGGRIALYYTNSSFAGTFSAVGGYGNQYGGAGTVYTKSASQTWGQLTLNNGGNAGAVTVLPGNAQEFDNVIIGGQAQAQVPANAVVTLVPTVLALGSNFNLTINGQLLCAGQAGGQFTQVRVANGGTMTLGAGSQLACADLQVFSGGTFVLNATNALTAGQVEVETNGTMLLNVPVSFPTLHVTTNGVVSCTVGQSNLNLTVTGNLTVDLGGSVLVDGLGYQGPGSGNGNGPGGGGGAVSGDYATGGGGGYGGLGGQANSGKLGGISYGSLTAPTNWGSSGGTGHDSYSGYYYAGGNGGGAMQLVVGGQLQVNGQITANGNNAAGVGSGYYYYPGGGGAGGSLWITASNLTGTGSIAANGGRSWNGNYGTGGGGGGGRIALYYTNSSFAGTFSAVGGYGNQYGGAGTVYTKSASQTWGQLTLNNGGNAGAVTVLPGNAQEFDNVIIGGQAQAQVPANAVVTLVPTVLALGSNFNLTINGQLLCAGQAGGQFTQVRVANGGTMTLGAGSQLACADLQVFSGGTFVLNATNALTAGQVEVETNGTMLLNVPVSFPTLHVTTNGVVSCTVGQSNLNLTVTGNLTVDLGGSVLVDGLGYQGPGSGNGNGPGGGGGAVSGDYATGGGGGYGGLGGQANSGKLGGISYGSLTAPTNWGSSGGTGHDSYSGYYYAGGNGGGAMQLVVGGQLQVNGQITANGNNAAGVGSGYYYYPGGGGAGGSLWITASNLTGTGSIAANGGRSWNGNYGTGGGGGGGRIATYFTNYTFGGVISVNGGTGYQAGQNGSIYSTPQNHNLSLDAQVLGILPTPVSVDSWLLIGVAGQQVRLQDVNMSAPDVLFDFSGPDGWAGFTGLSNESALLTLPSSGIYMLTARRTGSSSEITYTFDLQETAETNIANGTPFTGSLLGNGQAQLFVFNLTNGSPLVLSLANSGAGNVTGLYVGLGSPPTLASYNYSASAANSSSQQILIPEAVPGTYYVLVYGYQVSTPGSYTLSAATSDVFLTSVFPTSLTAGATATLTLTGAGFDPSTTVQVVSSGGTAYSTSSKSVNSFNQITATFAANSVPVGTYSVKVSKSDGSSATLTNAFQFTPAGQANLVTHLVVPSIVGRHEPSTLYVEYANTGTAAMPAPLLIVTVTNQGPLQLPIMATTPSLTPAEQQEGFWTYVLPPSWNTNVQFLAGGQIPGTLQPGESNVVAISYAGLLEPWSFAVTSLQFNLGVLTTTNTTSIDWPSLESSMQPTNLAADAWAADFQNLTNQLGPTWGSYLQKLDNDSTYLSQLGLTVIDIGQILAFEAHRADAMNVVRYLGGSLDAYVPTPGVTLGIQRLYSEDMSGRYKLGAFGRGWSHNWEMSLTSTSGGSSVTVLGPGTSVRTFLASTLGGYYPSPGDYGQLASLGGNSYSLLEASGITEIFNNGQLSYVKDPNGNTITCGYSGAKLATLTHSSGQSLSIAYNGSGTISSITDSEGRQTTFGYDSTGQHLVSATYPDGTSAAYDYTDPATASANPVLAHALTQVTPSPTNSEYFNYDNQGRLATVALNGGAQALSFAYDSEGTVFVTDSTSHTTTFNLENHGLLAKAQNPFTNSVFLDYDPNFNLTTFTDPTGQSYNFGYDTNGDLTQFTDTLGKTANVTYQSPFHRLASLVDANDNLTTYANDQNGNLRSIVYADASAEHWGYDTFGDPTTWTNRRGQVITYQFNPNGQPTLKVYPTGETIRYQYNSHSLPTNIADNIQGVTTLAFDYRDFLTNITYPNGQGFSFTYDAAGRRTSRTAFDGYTLNYAYDAVGRLATLTDGSNNVLVQYTYNGDGFLSQETKGNGTVTAYAYNAAGQLIDMTNFAPDGAVQSFFNYVYDANGNPMSMTDTDGDTTYTYDDLNQLTGVNYPNGHQVTYTYDPLGNRLMAGDNGTNATYISNDLNEYTQSGGVTCGYDADGNMTSQTSTAGTTTYQFDAENRLIAVITPTNGTWQYAYDSLGNRSTTIYNGVTNHYLVDPFGLVDVAADYNGSGSLLARYDQGLGLVARVDNSGSAAYYSFDALGNTRQVTGSDGTILNFYDYDAYGAATSASENISNPFRFVGRFGVADEQNGLHFMRARYYNALLGRFCVADPLGINGGSVNFYEYALNNPIALFDCEGLRLFMNPKNIARIGVKGFGVIYGFIGNVSDFADFFSNLGPYGNRSQAFTSGSGIIGSTVGGDVGETLGAFTGPVLGPLGPVLGGILGGYIGGVIGDTIGSTVWNSISPSVPTPPTSSLPGGGSGIGTVQDPNQLIGPTGYASQNYVVDGNIFGYEIFFANDTNATAPAQIVQITDPLSTNLNWTTFRVTGVSFGTEMFSIPPNVQQFQTNLPFSYNGVNFVIEISAGIQLATGNVYANFYSIVPSNGLPPPAGIGFLPPNTNGLGQGYISYTISPNPNLPTGLQISNVASVQFDQNPANPTDLLNDDNPSLGINTNAEALITIDSTPPVSSVQSLPPIETNASFSVCWSGTDAASGIIGYNIYVSTNSGPWTTWLAGTPNACAAFAGQPGNGYGFYSQAIDGAGNVETNANIAEASTTVELPNLVVTAFQPGPSGVSVDFNRAINASILSLFSTNAPPDFTLVGSNSGPVVGSLIIGDAATNAIFVKTGGPLAPDSYSATLVSATNGFQDLQGNLLAGNQGGLPGDNYVGQFTVAPNSNIVLSLPDFARAPGQAVNIPPTNSGIPLTLSGGSNVTSAALTIQYNTNLLNVTNVIPGSTLPTGWTMTNTPTSAGLLQLSFAGSVPLGPGTNTLVSLLASVPWCAPYASAGVLSIASAEINGGALPASGESSVQVVALLGDANGNGKYDIDDAELIESAFLDSTNGFPAYPLIDPVIIGAVDGSSQLTANDAVMVAQEAIGLASPLIPALPSPSLTTTVSNSVVLISWPQCTTGYILQQSATLGASSIWIPVTNATVNIGAQQAITVIPSGTSQFYRLQKP